MSISFSVHELHPAMQKSPICLIGTLWLDSQGIWLLNQADVPTVEIADIEASQQIRTHLSPVGDYLGQCLIYGWLTQQAKNWALERIYWVYLGELGASPAEWSLKIQVREVPPQYDAAR